MESSTPLLTVPVELSTTYIAPFEQVPPPPPPPQRQATSPLKERQPSRPADPTSPSPTHWERVHSRIKGTFRNYIIPPLENISDVPRSYLLSVDCSSRRKWARLTWDWCTRRKNMYQQVYINRPVTTTPVTPC